MKMTCYHGKANSKDRLASLAHGRLHDSPITEHPTGDSLVYTQFETKARRHCATKASLLHGNDVMTKNQLTTFQSPFELSFDLLSSMHRKVVPDKRRAG
jgi:hypothetical protein